MCNHFRKVFLSVSVACGIASALSGTAYMLWCAPYEFNSIGRYFDIEHSTVHTDNACVFAPLAIGFSVIGAIAVATYGRFKKPPNKTE